MTEIRAGRQFGQWTVAGKEWLGAGGNGQVWRVNADDGRDGAIKVLSAGGGPRGRYRLGRFRDEIAFLLAHPHTEGILPLLDHRISPDPGQTSWYVMPVATPLRAALGSDPEPGTVVAAIGEIAATLASLATEGVAHRDIKPDNLFELDGRWAIGDFGLVTYPDKDPRTQHGRKLGPVDYMAPEMRQDADLADPGPADVWALAKSLWVLLAGQELPLPGTHRPAEPAYALRDRITFRFAAELDLLLEKATAISPPDRPSMAEMARELQACAARPPEARPASGIGELHARATALTAASRQQTAQRRKRQDRLDTSWQELAKAVAGTASELAEQLTFYNHSRECGYLANEFLGMPSFTAHAWHNEGWLLIPHGQVRPAVDVAVAAALRVMREDDPADIAALVRVSWAGEQQGTSEHHNVWVGTYQGIPLASAQHANAIADIRAGFKSSIAGTLVEVIRILSAATGPPVARSRPVKR